VCVCVCGLRQAAQDLAMQFWLPRGKPGKLMRKLGAGGAPQIVLRLGTRWPWHH
jgi:hypothetical protein